MKLTIGYCTAREHPEIGWFLDSLCHQIDKDDKIKVIVVDYFKETRPLMAGLNCPIDVYHVLPKPNVWQGKHRLTKKEWWAKSAYINTAICLCETDWIAFCDDRSVLLPGWLNAIKRAERGQYAVAGSYEKRKGMTVENGFIKHGGIVIGEDPRKWKSTTPIPGSHWFGCTNALPLEWALRINGADESCDSLGMEDVVFGQMLGKAGCSIQFDPQMKIVEDRSEATYEAAVGRTDKGISPKDKSHGILTRIHDRDKATHHWNLRDVRKVVMAGQGFPIPTEPTHDWWDNKPLVEFP